MLLNYYTVRTSIDVEYLKVLLDNGKVKCLLQHAYIYSCGSLSICKIGFIYNFKDFSQKKLLRQK